ncbi:hypothetical protein Tco_0637800 [Tanacetum coccineum]
MSLRRARILDRVWSGRYDVRGTVEESLRRARNLGQDLGTLINLGFGCPLSHSSGTKVVYDVPGTLIGSGLVYDGPRNLDRLRSRFLGAMVVYDVPRNVD